ncbi:MAG: ComF family protein [Candidatus Cloacimonetes bacterium]|nr:ComF family protein [Candidatus Cloacimonadota bacterium]
MKKKRSRITRRSEQIEKFLQQIYNLLAPQICYCCLDRMPLTELLKTGDLKKDKLWEISRYLCPACIENLVILKDDICPKCGSPLRTTGCPHCTQTSFKFIAARSVFLFDERTRPLIHGLKYHQFLKIAPVLAAYAALYLENHWRWQKPDIIIPVPLHRVKLRERDFNQSAIIGRWLAQLTHIDYREDIIIRNRYTRTQTALDRKQRHQNVSGAFTLRDAEYLKDKCILILDDVFTTGSTCNAMAHLLRDNQITQVFVLTIARPS